MAVLPRMAGRPAGVPTGFIKYPVRRTARKRCLWELENGGFAFARPQAFFGGGLASFRRGESFAARLAMSQTACMADPNRPRDPGKGEAFHATG